MVLPAPNGVELSFNVAWLNQIEYVDYPLSEEQKLFYKQFLNKIENNIYQVPNPLEEQNKALNAVIYASSDAGIKNS